MTNNPNKITITDEEAHGEPRYLLNGDRGSPDFTRMKLAQEYSGLPEPGQGGNVLWHGYDCKYVPEKKEWHFVKVE